MPSFITSVPYPINFSPTSVDGCQVWLDGADSTRLTTSSGYVTAIVDKVNSVSFSAAGTDITYSTINSVQSLNFGGSSSLSGGSFAEPSSAYVFIVFKPTLSQNAFKAFVSWRTNVQVGEPMFGYNNSGTNGIGFYESNRGTQSPSYTVTVGTSYIAAFSFNNTATSLAMNGALTPTTGSQSAPTTSGTSALFICFDPNVTTAVNIGEVIVYNTSSITTTQRQSIEGYLAQKWGLTASLPAGHPGLSQTFYTPGVVTKSRTFLTKQVYTSQGPLSVTGCVMWLDGADPAGTGTAPSNGASVSTWVDKSGSNNSGTAGSAATYSSSQRALLFGTGTGSAAGYSQNAWPSGNYYTTPYTANPTNETCYLVFNLPVIGYGFAISGHSCGGRSFATPTSGGYPTTTQLLGGVNCYSWGVTASSSIYANTTYIGKLITNANNQYGSINGSNMAGPTAQSPSSVTTDIGAQNANSIYFNGYIKEIIFYNRVLSSNEQLTIQAYLANKWNITASLPTGHPTSTAITPTGITVINAVSIPYYVGGTISFSGGYTVHSFTTVGSNTFTVLKSVTVQALIVGGGGSGGGYYNGGGGGAGGVIRTSFTLPPGSYQVVVGAGGNAVSANNTNGNSGSNSTFYTATAIGGGYGGAGTVGGQTYGNNGGSGGSGGGAGGGGNTGGSGTSSQGNLGGNGYYTTSTYWWCGGGGGGASNIGSNGDPSGTGAGGAGINITVGTTVYTVGGGGGAGTANYSFSNYCLGGIGGGGNGAVVAIRNASDGQANTGGGGGGGGGDGYQAGSRGGSGIVILWY